MSYKTYEVRVYTNGDTFWYQDDELHREEGPSLDLSSGYKAWYLEGKRHRKDGPAVEDTDGYKAWYQDGELHRDDGPAIEWADGDKSWFLEGKYLSEAEFNARMNPDPCEGKVVEIDGRKYTLTSVKCEREDCSKRELK